MKAEQLKIEIIDALEALKAIDLVELEVTSLTDVTDFMIFASGTSSRHVKSLADNIVVALKKQKMPPLGVEGHQVGEWVLVDCGDVVVHIMLPETREFYDLERLWRNGVADEYSKD